MLDDYISYQDDDYGRYVYYDDYLGGHGSGTGDFPYTYYGGQDPSSSNPFASLKTSDYLNPESYAYAFMDWINSWGGDDKDVLDYVKTVWDGTKWVTRTLTNPVSSVDDLLESKTTRYVFDRARGSFVPSGAEQDPTSEYSADFGWSEHPLASTDVPTAGKGSKTFGEVGPTPKNPTMEQVKANPELYLTASKMLDWAKQNKTKLTPQQYARAINYAKSWHYFIGNEAYFQRAFNNTVSKDAYLTWNQVVTSPDPNATVQRANNLNIGKTVDYTGVAGSTGAGDFYNIKPGTTDMDGTQPTSYDGATPPGAQIDIGNPNAPSYNTEAFWKSFVDQFYGIGDPGDTNYAPSYKDILEQSQDFKTQAIDSYLTKLKNLGDEKIREYDLVTGKYKRNIESLQNEIRAKKGNVGFGMTDFAGQDFKMDFTPKSVMQNREMQMKNYKDILASQLTNIDTGFDTGKGVGLETLGYNLAEKNPAKPMLDYLSTLQQLGSQHQQFQNNLALANIANPVHDPSVLEVMKDVVDIAGPAYNLGEKISNSDWWNDSEEEES